MKERLPQPRDPFPLRYLDRDRNPDADRDFRWLTELQYLAVQHIRRTGREAYQLELSEAHDGRAIPHYYFEDGYHTTSEDAAVNHLRTVLAAPPDCDGPHR